MRLNQKNKVMSVIGAITGALGKKNIGNIVNGAISGIDKLVLTKEEKAEAMFKIADAQAEFVKSQLNASTISSLTRRYISLAITIVFLGLSVTGVVAWKIDPLWANFIFDVLTGTLGTLMITVAAFYFGGYMFSNHLFKNKEKDKKK